MSGRVRSECCKNPRRSYYELWLLLIEISIDAAIAAVFIIT